MFLTSLPKSQMLTIFMQFLSDGKTPEQYLRHVEIQLPLCCRKQDKRTEIQIHYRERLLKYKPRDISYT